MAKSVGCVSIVGAGLIGLGWARRCLQNGYEVAIWDPGVDWKSLEAKLPAAGWSLHEHLADAVGRAMFVQESVPENIDLKHRLYAEMAGSVREDAVVASSTSTLMPSDLQDGVAFADRLLVGHPFNPPDVLPLVEIVPGRKTSPNAVSAAVDFYDSLQQRPIVLRRERAGHLANRLQAAVWREAVDAVASGQASVKDVDVAMTSSLGPRWAIQGPFASFHMGGGVGGLEYFLDQLGPKFEHLWRDANIPVVDPSLRQSLIEAAAGLVATGRYEQAVEARNHTLLTVLAAAENFERLTQDDNPEMQLGDG